MEGQERRIKYYCILKRVNLENTVLCRRNQSQKTTYCLVPFRCNVQNGQMHRDRKQIASCQGLGLGEQVMAGGGQRGSIWANEDVLK